MRGEALKKCPVACAASGLRSERRGQRVTRRRRDYSGRGTVDNPVDWFRRVLIPGPSSSTVNPPARVLGFAGRPNVLIARPALAGGRSFFLNK